ncbi:MAG: hypothetical protein V3T30_02265, partial [Thermodesulfobacteriota bacterium]
VYLKVGGTEKMANGNYPEYEWTVEEWTDAWNIRVGSAYACKKCGSMIIVTKGGVGVLEPNCCGVEMSPFEDEEEAK